MSTVNQNAVYWQIAKSWLYSLAILSVSLVLMFVVSALAVGLIGPVALTFVGFSVLLGLCVFVFSEHLVVYMTGAVEVSPSKDSHLCRIYREVCTVAGFGYHRPRLYVVDDGPPNAFAFGPGFFGQSAVAVTRSLLTLMSGEQVKAVLAHELGHIVAKDVGLMTVVTLVSGAGGQLSQQLFRTGIRHPHTFVLGCLLWLCSHLLLPLGEKAISREREKAADAYAAWRCGTPQPLIEALKTLEKHAGRTYFERSFVEKLMISHPDTKERIKLLEGYR